jgi:hypothetical protein
MGSNMSNLTDLNFKRFAKVCKTEKGFAWSSLKWFLVGICFLPVLPLLSFFCFCVPFAASNVDMS